jgi:hypothetical protein
MGLLLCKQRAVLQNTNSKRELWIDCLILVWKGGFGLEDMDMHMVDLKPNLAFFFGGFGCAIKCRADLWRV